MNVYANKHRALAALARAWNSAYLEAMSRPVSAPDGMVPAPLSKSGAAFFIVWGAATVGVLAVVAAAMLWLHYGTAVFFEMIAAGIAACF